MYAAVDDWFTMAPPPREIIDGATARDTSSAPVSEMSKNLFQYDTGMFMQPYCSMSLNRPALLMQKSTPPNAAIASLAMLSVDCSSDTSHCTAMALPPPAPLISSATRSPAAPLSSAMTTLAPSAANALA